MASINWNSIMAKAEAACEKSSVKRRMDKRVEEFILGHGGADNSDIIYSNNVILPNEVGGKFIAVICAEIRWAADAGLIGQDIASALSNYDLWEYHDPVKLYGNRYRIYVYFNDYLFDLHRKSLFPEGYPDGIENIMALLNNGYRSNAKRMPTGYWHGTKIRAPKFRVGAHFIEQAKIDFAGNYGSDCGLIEITDNITGGGKIK